MSSLRPHLDTPRRPPTGSHLPPLEHALASATIEPLHPESAHEAPEPLIAALLRSTRVLVVSHVPPDGDCVGGSVGLARLLRALGKDATVCIDDALPANLRKFERTPGAEIKRARELEGDYDLVVIVDVAAKDRIGDVLETLRRASEVIVVDHHPVDPSHEALGIDAGVPLHAWVDSEADAASLMIASIASRLASARPEIAISAEQWSLIMQPLIAGTFTDTYGFCRPGASLTALRIYKHLVATHLEGDQGSIHRMLDYALPAAAALLLRDLPGFTGGSSSLISCPKVLADLALAAARLEHCDAELNDVRGHLLHRLDESVQRFSVSALLFETDRGVLVSTRSREPGPALDLARHIASRLGGAGDGHLRMAGGNVQSPLNEVEVIARHWLERFEQRHMQRSERSVALPPLLRRAP